MTATARSRTGDHEPDDPDVIDLVDPVETVDEILDLTDRRRILLHTLFGVAVPPSAADAVFR
jgi:hypothetical protein